TAAWRQWPMSGRRSARPWPSEAPTWCASPGRSSWSPTLSAGSAKRVSWPAHEAPRDTPAREDLMTSDRGSVPGRVVDDRVLAPGLEWAGVVRAGLVLRIVDLEGRQAVDFLCYRADDPSERYNAADTMKLAGTIFLTTGHGLYSDLGRRLFTIVA